MCKSALVLMLSAALASAADAPLRLWPGTAPGDKGDIGQEVDTTKPDGNLVAGRRVARIGNVTVPTLTVFRAPRDKATGAAVLVFPGGGYNILAYDLEGTEVCEWLNSIGVTGVLVKYRVPARQGMPRYMAALQDAQRATGMVRHHAKEWGIDPARIGVLGFSAGAHLSAALSNQYEKRAYEPVDAADSINCRPDFAVLVYPGGSVSKDDKLSPELAVTVNTPRTFIVQTQDDNVRVENSVLYYMALKNAKVPVEMHLYSTGGHGYGLRRTQHAVTTWPLRAEDWLRTTGILERR